MNLKFWKKKPKLPLYEFSVRNVPTSTLERWYLYDTGISDTNGMGNLMGLNPVSEEVGEAEAEDSVRRVARVEPFKEFAKQMSQINASGIAAVNLQHLIDAHPDFTEEDVDRVDSMEEANRQVSFVAIFTALSIAMELGILVNPGTTAIEGTNNVYE